MLFSKRLGEAMWSERTAHGAVLMAPSTLRQTTFVAETNVRLFDTIASQRLVLDTRTEAFLQSLADSVRYDRAMYSSALQVDEECFLDRMFSHAFDERYVAALWYCKVVGDIETTLCNAIPLTYPSTVFFASREQAEALTDSFDRGTTLWSDDDRNVAVRNVESAYTFIRMLDYGMQCIK